MYTFALNPRLKFYYYTDRMKYVRLVPKKIYKASSNIGTCLNTLIILYHIYKIQCGTASYYYEMLKL